MPISQTEGYFKMPIPFFRGTYALSVGLKMKIVDTVFFFPLVFSEVTNWIFFPLNALNWKFVVSKHLSV